MSQIEELHGRIAAAMDRIGAGLEALTAESVMDAEADLAALLEEEKQANAQLEERLRAINDTHAAEIESLRAELSGAAEADDLREQLAALRSRFDDQLADMVRLDRDIGRLRQANEQLRESNAALRQANEAGVGEPHLINKAMLAELEGLRAMRAADAAEASAVLSKLEPLLAEAARANGEGA